MRIAVRFHVLWATIEAVNLLVVKNRTVKAKVEIKISIHSIELDDAIVGC